MASDSSAATRDQVVSFDSEELILVNENDEEVGHLDKSSCHDGDGVLHRAFSLFIFNARGELLLQQRSGGKRLWPLTQYLPKPLLPVCGEPVVGNVLRQLGRAGCERWGATCNKGGAFAEGVPSLGSGLNCTVVMPN